MGLHSAFFVSAARSTDTATRTAAHNISSDVVGYKKGVAVTTPFMTQVGASLITFPQSNTSSTEFSQGTFQKTEDSCDLAISGKAFFEVETPGGVKYLLRQGDFSWDPANHHLITSKGYALCSQGSPISFPNRDFTIKENGDVIGQNAQGAGHLYLVSVDDPSTLTNLKDGYFSVPANVETRVATHSKIHQGFLEKSNVNTMQEMVILNLSQEQHAATAQSIKQSNRMERDAIHQLGKPE